MLFLSQKGGVGKTTLATCIAVAAEADGKTSAIFDLDPQATASFWKDVREAETPAVESIQAVRLPTMLKAAEAAGADLAIIDGAAVARDIAFEAARHADFVLIPTKAAVFDTMSMIQTIDTVKQAEKPFSVVLTFVPPQGQETSDAMTMAGKLSAAVCPVLVGNRKAYFRAQGQGQAVQEFEPDGKAAEEIQRLYAIHVYTYTMKRMLMPAKQNSLQAVLDRQKIRAEVEDIGDAAVLPAKTPDKHGKLSKPTTRSRSGRVLIGGHFPPDVSKQLAIIAAEEGMTKQDLLEEALDLLFVKKGKKRIRDL